MKFDSVVLGGGIVGVSVALQLQWRGLAVALVDRKAPGNETSLGNAGLIQREGVYPYAFPRDFCSLARYACNRATDVRFHPPAMPRLMPFLMRYWHHSRADRHARIARAYSTLIEHCVTEHRAMIEAAGAQALLRTGGWMKVFRTEGALNRAIAEARQWEAEYGVEYDALDRVALKAAEPSLGSTLVGAVRYTLSDSVSDPSGLVTAYAKLFERLGGKVLIGDAGTLEPSWCVMTQDGPVEAKSAVVAMGPWSGDVASKFGYNLPLAVKRGYHMHYAPAHGAKLNQPVLDAEVGYMITPMVRGIRLTTGVELGHRDAAKTPVQLEAVEPFARDIFPLGARVDAEPWLGRRPCTPDMMPIISEAPRHRDLWFAFGHAHHGLTLGPVTGRLIAEMITGEQTVVDPKPFRVDRF
ncbi:NAD(P)/FAD-dependent oxidoreductase [Burkholderia pseudomallei]|uniref:NAD(P)/FAD-dependent oxidoreductase n=1 Tax=Burkholderia pseudomallei TaxID=28450 RepID=UPI0005373935|nr:FAD-binding oxidoreductase [Burkholderia pseudomallei]KGW18050.1 FAD dependent oxidoreductase family protein [Burkholderia pseudomallei MSHR4000]KGW80505.1 FAD dependent oxidoreductase family protein [Burkholderia pseudomallei MSHR456]OMW46852.1 amino acid dehydrogenase [Burkholderia pseudomallei]